MKKARLRTFGHMLRLHGKAPHQMAMTDYFQIPANLKQCSWRKRYTLLVKIDEDLKEVKWNNNIILSKLEIKKIFWK